MYSKYLDLILSNKYDNFMREWGHAQAVRTS